jgi:hypothetical protein
MDEKVKAIQLLDIGVSLPYRCPIVVISLSYRRAIIALSSRWLSDGENSQFVGHPSGFRLFLLTGISSWNRFRRAFHVPRGSPPFRGSRCFFQSPASEIRVLGAPASVSPPTRNAVALGAVVSGDSCHNCYCGRGFAPPVIAGAPGDGE